jgi:hypothetical protein
MSHRVHRHLDGELPLAALSESERQEVEAYRVAFHAAMAPLLEQEVPDISGPVMSAIRPGIGERPAGLTRNSPWTLGNAWRWLWRPRVLVLRTRPAWGFALVAAAAFVLINPSTDPPTAVPVQMGGTVVAASAVEGRVMVVFRLDAPGVQGVRLAGDFTDWVPGPALTEVSPGVWSTAVPVDLGIHDYAFVVDGTRWVPDPLAEQVDDGFGGSNSRGAVLLSGQEGEV